MRPVSIIWFERLFLLSIALALVSSVVQYDALLAQIQSDPAFARMGWGGGFLIGVLALSALIPLLLWYFIARRASNLAKWLLVALIVVGLFFVNFDFATMLAPGNLASILVTLMQIAAVALLFRPDARAWLGSGGDRHVAP
jgi:phosphoglycerol transferase MdoB-like AlkP superfamily enzyme